MPDITGHGYVGKLHIPSVLKEPEITSSSSRSRRRGVAEVIEEGCPDRACLAQQTGIWRSEQRGELVESALGARSTSVNQECEQSMGTGF